MDKTNDYIQRINKVIDYIEANLDADLRLDDLARIACLSKHHFHRIFYAFTEEPLYGFVTRLRTERSATLLLSQDKSITDIAAACGYNDSATFARAFKKHFGMPASEWKKKKLGKIHQDRGPEASHHVVMKSGGNTLIEPLATEEKRLDDTRIAYVRHTGPYAGNAKLFQSLHKKLMDWAVPAGVANYPTTKDVVIYHDSPGITADDRLRVSVGITVPDDAPVAGEIGSLVIPRGRYLSCRFALHNDEYGKAWTAVYGNILPRRGLRPNDGYSFELYPPDCHDGESDTTTVEIFVPIRRF